MGEDDRRKGEDMRIVRNILVVVFILSLGVFGISELIQYTNRDTTQPEITSSIDVLEIPCEYTEEQLLEGLSATDGTDGDLTSKIIPGSFTRFIETGVSNLNYVVFDSSNQSASLTRKVRFTDYHSPRFTLTEPLVFTVQEGSYSDAMERLGAQDMLDGDLKDWIVQTDTDVNYGRTGSYTMTVAVSNSFGDTSEAALPVHVINAGGHTMDIRLTSSIVYVGMGDAFDPYSYLAGVADAQGNDVGTANVSAQSGVDTQNPGVYEVYYTVSDGAGGAGETWLTVIVEG